MSKPRSRRRLVLALLLLQPPLWIALWANSAGGSAALAAWAREQGHHRFERDTGFFGALLAAPWYRTTSPRAPELRIDLKARDFALLTQLREQALQKGLIEDAEQTPVPARLLWDGRTLAGEVRLKGDFTDHLHGDKWSLRVELDADGAHGAHGAHGVYGMRRFSVQDPATKGFQGERLFFWLLARQGVIAPRYEVARVWLGGMDFGVMAVEEHVGDELLAHNGRAAGVVVHFDETMVFHGRDDYREASVIAFGERRLQRDPVLGARLPAALACLREFTDGHRGAGATFDAATTGALLASCELLGSWHALRWHNLRFLHDAASDRLLPIAFDGNLHMARPVEGLMLFEQELTKRLLCDDGIHAAYVAAQQRLLADVLDGDLAAAMAAEEARHLPFLQREFTMLRGYDPRELRRRATVLRERGPVRRALPGDFLGPCPLIAYQQPGVGEVALVLRNGHTEELRVTGLRWAPHGGGEQREPATGAGWSLPIGVPPRGDALRAEFRVQLAPPRDANLRALEVLVEGHGDPVWQRAVVNAPPPLR